MKEKNEGRCCKLSKPDQALRPLRNDGRHVVRPIL
jgi:hypothetical protein